jgi:hypothetical protein
MKLTIIKNPIPNPKPSRILLLEILGHKEESHELVENFDLLKAINDRFHIVSVAFIGLTNFSSLCEFYLNIKQREQYQMTELINLKGETGTFYPLYNLTVLPYGYITNSFGQKGYDCTEGKGSTIDEVENHVQDAIKAEKDFIKSGKILFDFRDFGKDMLRYRNLLYYYLTKKFSEYDWECYMYSFDNHEFESE